jgi:hypothetical protein
VFATEGELELEILQRVGTVGISIKEDTGSIF